MTSSGQTAYITPAFSPSDPLVCRSVQLRPQLWSVLFNELQRLGQSWQWYQDDPAHATVQEVIGEINAATDAAVFSGCQMIGEIKELVLNTVPAWLLPCDGAVYLGADYPLLWAVIHDNLKTDATHFRTPQRARRVAWGEVVGAQEGAENHTLTLAQIPEHAHSYTMPLLTDDFLGEIPSLGYNDVELTDTGVSGSGEAHNNIQPMEGAQFYIVAALPTAG